jgi:hypothetical protein
VSECDIIVYLHGYDYGGDSSRSSLRVKGGNPTLKV